MIKVSATSSLGLYIDWLIIPNIPMINLFFQSNRVSLIRNVVTGGFMKVWPTRSSPQVNSTKDCSTLHQNSWLKSTTQLIVEKKLLSPKRTIITEELRNFQHFSNKFNFYRLWSMDQSITHQERFASGQKNCATKFSFLIGIKNLHGLQRKQQIFNLSLF